MKLIKSMLLLPTILFAFSANATLITDSQHTLLVGPPATVSNPDTRLFSVLPSFFGTNVITLGFSSGSVTNSVEVTEVSNGDGTVTRTETTFSLELARTLLSLVFDSVTDITGFNPATDFVVSGNILDVNIANKTLGSNAAVTFNARYETQELGRQLISSESTIVRASSNPTEVSAPTAFGLVLLGFAAVVGRRAVKIKQ